MARSLNKVELIGNITRDPELRYTPGGKAVCTFSIATNRQWKTESGEAKEEAEFHRIVAWDKLGETCAQYLKKGSRIYVEGRIQSRKWTGQDNVERTTVEIVILTMIMLDSRRSDDFGVPDDLGESQAENKPVKKDSKKTKKVENDDEEPPIDDSDIPF